MTAPERPAGAGAAHPAYDGMPVLVAGGGVSGGAAARVLRDLGARVTVAEDRPAQADALQARGFAVVPGLVLPAPTALVVTSPGWRPDSALLRAATSRGVEVIGEVELAWRLRPPGAAPWLALTGTNGKTTTVKMLQLMLATAGHRAVAAGNVGLPLLEAVLDRDPYDVLAVELSSFQLHWSATLRPHAAAILNIAPDHIDWHGSTAAYAAAKASIYSGEHSIGNLDDLPVRELLAAAPGRRTGFTLQVPAWGQVGRVEDLLVDRAFHSGKDVRGEATELAMLSDLTVPGAHNVANALAAATLARSFGVPATAVRDGLRAFRADRHRNEPVAVPGPVAYVDDSKATNPHAAAASLASYDPVVWLAGGLLKGAEVDDLVRSAAGRLRAVVLLGTDREPFLRALRRHAPDVPVQEVVRLDNGAMAEVVNAARAFARPGDTVLLAPAAASMDCFRDYAERGELFAAAALDQQ